MRIGSRTITRWIIFSYLERDQRRFRRRPQSIPLPGIVVSFRTLLKVEKGARVSSENCGNVLRRAQIANLSNAPPKRDQSFRRNCTQAEYSTIAQLPKRSADVRGERISAERMDRDSPAAARRVLSQTKRRYPGNSVTVQLP